MSEKNLSQDSLSLSNSTNATNVSFSESLLLDINNLNNKNIVIITKNLEQKIPDILSFLQNNSNLAVNKKIIVKYLQNLFLSIKINSEVFLRKYSSEKNRLNLYQIIIEQYITYTNINNSKTINDNETQTIIPFGLAAPPVGSKRRRCRGD